MRQNTPTETYPKYRKLETASLIPYARNSRTHTQQQIDKVAASIEEFGFLNPVIVDGNNGIVAGHCRVLAAEQLGIKTLPCIEASHLTEAQKKAYIIADNRLALDAGWHIDILKGELEELNDFHFDLDLLGFDTNELQGLLNSGEFGAGGEEDQGKLDEISPKYVTCPNCSIQFDCNATEK